MRVRICPGRLAESAFPQQLTYLMTPSELEARFVQYDERIAALEAEKQANSWFTLAVIGSHPDTEMLLEVVRAAIQTLRGKTSPEGPAGVAAATVLRLLEIERQILKTQQSRQELAEAEEAERLSEQQRAAAEQER